MDGGKNKGFSLIELIIVMAIMAVLVGVLVPSYIRFVEKTRKAVDRSNADSIREVIYMAITSNEINLGRAAGHNPCGVIFTGYDSGSKTYNVQFRLSDEVVLNGLDGAGYAAKTGISDNGHSRLRELLESNGIVDADRDDHIFVHSNDDAVNGWSWYAVLLFDDGSMRTVSGFDTTTNANTFLENAAAVPTETTNIEKKQ